MLQNSMMWCHRLSRPFFAGGLLCVFLLAAPGALLAQGGGVGGGVGAVPEPGTLLLLAVGMAAYGAAQRRG